ncbi:hypothetical protein BB561_004052, partial [Smittium simulii]
FKSYSSDLNTYLNRHNSPSTQKKLQEYYLSVESSDILQQHAINSDLSTKKSVLIFAVPYISFHIEKLSKILSEHSAFFNKNAEFEDIISKAYYTNKPGFEKLNSKIETITSCYKFTENELPEKPRPVGQDSNSEKSEDLVFKELKTSIIKNSKLTVYPHALANSPNIHFSDKVEFYKCDDKSIQHWLLSRPFVSTNSLRDASFALLPISIIDENLEWFSNEEEHIHIFSYPTKISFKKDADYVFAYSDNFGNSDDDLDDAAKLYYSDEVDARLLSKISG